MNIKWPIAPLAIILTVSTCSHIYSQVASPIQGGHYMPGLMNMRDFAYPPSGLFFLQYNFYFESNRFLDKDGNEFKRIPVSDFFPSLPDIEVSTELKGFGFSTGIFWASKKISSLGNARYLSGVAPSYSSADASFITQRPGIIIDTVYTNVTQGKNSGFGDIMVVPLGLSWGFEKMDFTFMYAFYAPSGKYQTGSDENIGFGFWTHQFQGFSYYYPKPDKSTALLLGLTYEINSEIKDAAVKPGSRFTIEWGISQFLSEKFEVGIHGGHNWQVTDDTGGEVFWDPQVHDKKSSLVFNASYWPIKERLMINFKYGLSYGIKQGFKTSSGNINILFVPNLFTSD